MMPRFSYGNGFGDGRSSALLNNLSGDAIMLDYSFIYPSMAPGDGKGVNPRMASNDGDGGCECSWSSGDHFGDG